ncbi:NADPH-dependent FMN reductase [Liquorilactobacillus hordei]|uniref:Oxidoreductase n=1 Tax=Liquorilactobacillus hordei DSM 19519 TaxID=1423759 RepID=A0A0R1M9X9_9LACO|nr:NADPH-dependent FMN reductase [Liquorilactobacillus hordei]KRL05047.1 oxidoreductase [Liquorilactobacillus hordei DSM 19519]QYH51655.1 NAD(P)H-dependent oxidoreductase [Liquorilactobacillus hordei DSM 19519]
MINLIGIVGTGAAESTNRKLLQYMKKHFSTQATIEIFELTNLPFFDKPTSKLAPEIINQISQKIIDADGVIISTPEYDHTIPAALTSLLEWFAYTTQPLRDKPTMITGASYGVLGTSRAQAHLRQILNAPELSGLLMPGREYLLGGSLQAFADEGELADVAKKEELDRYFGDFMRFVAKNR